MELTRDLTVNPNTLVAKKGTKDKLKDMYDKSLKDKYAEFFKEGYIKYFGVPKDKDTLRKLHSLNLDIQHLVGSILVTIYAKPFAPVIIAFGGKVVKPLRLKAYDTIKGTTDKIVGVEVPEDGNEVKIELDEEEKKSFMEGLKNAFDSFANKKDSSVEIESVESKGKSI